MKKRAFATILLLSLVCGMLGLTAFAEKKPDESVYVFVTICDGTGELVLAREEIAVRDLNSDGVYTIDEALYCAHEAKFSGGADGYASEETAYGCSLTKLWGTANGGGYGYYLNHQSPQSLSDSVASGDLVSVFVYTDMAAYTDVYCFFDKDHVAVSGDDKLSLTLYSYSYDDNWNLITVPVADAVIMIDGKETSFVTDADGKVTLSFDGTGYCVVSAAKEGALLVPPVCAVAVSGAKLPAGDGSLVLWFALIVVSLVTVRFLQKHARHAL